MGKRALTIWLRIVATLALACTLVLHGDPVSARWHEAQTDRFVIYADDSERDIRRFAANLERYHAAMEIITGRRVEQPSPSNRVTIFVVGSQRELQRTLDIKSRTIGGIYIARAGASRAYVQDIQNREGEYSHFSTVILLHEYAHHFLISSSRFAMPRWLGEGMAEFFAATVFDDEKGLQIGLPATHRGRELFYAKDVSVRELLDPELYEAKRGRGYDAFYGRSWLLYHYLTFNDARSGQLDAYWTSIAQGVPSLEAGEAAFGDLDTLEGELNAYLRSGARNGLSIANDKLPVGPIALRELPEGEAKMMNVRMASQAGVSREQARELLIDARKIAAKYPRDPGVLTALAEAEYDAGHDAEAIAAADAALALNPQARNAYVQKGLALFRRARQAGAEDKDAAYEAAMQPFAALNKLENDHPLPLIHYYRSYTERGAEPSENARAALEQAARLAPFDQRVWVNVAMMQASEGKVALARNSLAPVLANPHGGPQAAAARAFDEALAGRKEGEPVMLRYSRGNEEPEETAGLAGEEVEAVPKR